MLDPHHTWASGAKLSSVDGLGSRDPELVMEKVRYLPMHMAPSLPDRPAPALDRRVAFGAGSSCHHVSQGNVATTLWNRQLGPLPPVLRHSHMRSLDFPAGELALQMEIQTGECECDGDRLRCLVRMLRAMGIHRVLVDERWAGVRKRVRHQLVVQIVVGLHGKN